MREIKHKKINKLMIIKMKHYWGFDLMSAFKNLNWIFNLES